MRTLAITLTLLGIAAALLTPTATASGLPGGDPQCMQYYHKTTIGPITIVNRDSCHSEYYLCDRTLGDATQAEHPLDCITTT